MTTSYQQEKQLIIEIGRRLWLRGMVAANDGNISCRVPGGYLITRSGISKGFMREEDILLLDSQGCPLSDGPGQPSSETAMHLGIYQSRPQTGAIVHAHPPYATAFALAEADINQAQLEELRIQLGEVAMIPYAPAGTSELAPLWRISGPDCCCGMARLQSEQILWRPFTVLRHWSRQRKSSFSAAS